MAARIERVEKEFILGAAAEAGTLARIQASGRTIDCRLVQAGKELLRFSPAEEDSALFKAWDRVAVRFDFRGQTVAFSAPVRRASRGLLELSWPEAMYRGLSRRFARVPAPRDFCADLLLPDLDLRLGCPECREYAEVERPAAKEGLDADTLASLVAAFKEKAAFHASESRVVMWKDGRGPADAAEDLVANLGRILYIPSTLSGLPLADPYPEGRVITRAMLEDYESPASLAGDSPLGERLAALSREGLAAALWCPILYYRYAVGLVYLGNDGASRKPFDLRAVDFAWEFSRLLAWLLKRHGYFGAAEAEPQARRGAVVDASPSGALIEISGRAPRLKQGSAVELLLSLGDKSYSCRGRVARRWEDKGSSYYGLAFEGLAEEARAELERGLYGVLRPEAPGGRA